MIKTCSTINGLGKVNWEFLHAILLSVGLRRYQMILSTMN